MDWLYIFTLFWMGAIVGSFLNVVILRYNTGFKVTGRSKCFSCGRTLEWIDLVPILSFFLLKSRCRSCSSKISYQYPIVEVLTGSILVLLYISGFKGLLLSYIFISICSLIVILVYDIRHKIIPDGVVFLFIVLSLGYIFIDFTNLVVVRPNLWAILAGPIIALPFASLWLFSSGRWMGLGDGKLALGIGWFLGVKAGILAVLLAFWIGTIISLILIGLSNIKFFDNKFGKFSLKSEIPFAPFLILGFLAVILYELNLMDLRLFQFLML